jgi:hypothetical protein
MASFSPRSGVVGRRGVVRINLDALSTSATGTSRPRIVRAGSSGLSEYRGGDSGAAADGSAEPFHVAIVVKIHIGVRVLASLPAISAPRATRCEGYPDPRQTSSGPARLVPLQGLLQTPCGGLADSIEFMERIRPRVRQALRGPKRSARLPKG